MRYHDVNERIEARNREADYHLKHGLEEGSFAHKKAKAGLAAANTVDRTMSLGDDEKSIFVGNIVSGATRGAFYGAVAAFVAVGCVMGAAAVALPLYLGCMAAGALIFGVVDSQIELERHVNNNERKLADRIAEASGAVPSKINEIELNKAIFHSPEREAYVKEVSAGLAEEGIKIDDKRKPGNPDFIHDTDEPSHTSRVVPKTTIAEMAQKTAKSKTSTEKARKVASSQNQAVAI